MKIGIVFLFWFTLLAVSFTFLGGLINGLSNNTIFTNQDVAIPIAIALAILVAAMGACKKLLPGA